MTNQFTNEQVERATSLADDLEGRMTRQEWLPASLGIRAAALFREFAASVAPQAPPRINRDKLVAVIDAEAGSYDPITAGCGYHASLKLADGSDMAERIADKVIRAAIVSVQPSSTVDEGRLADVIEGSHDDWTRAFIAHQTNDEADPGPLADYQARAVVEAIGGEGK